LTLTSWPSPPEVPSLSAIHGLDKLVHVGLYAVEAFLLFRAVAWPGRRDVFSLLRVAAIVGTMAVWGTADEIHQFWIPGRFMEAGDVVADVAGAAIGALLASALSLSPRERERLIS
jgi:VanZ family protein